ncbi:hypothetical protein CICLE_v10026771mg [Citrus x clementina]|uniref:DUF7046 domain-containing protein n=2 Tax=Citrus clementina TaxID=85681 RepID=V4SWA5_CITCL|nr:hypothetical protein CICLE_v10026771mg [Citrus x clementina]
MQNHIEKTLYSGHASFKVSLSTGYLDIWEPATLAIKREAFTIKCSGPSGVVITEKFSPTTTVTIPYGNPTEFFIIGSNGSEHLLRADGSTTDVSWLVKGGKEGRRVYSFTSDAGILLVNVCQL